MSFLTCFWLFPQKEHLSRSPPSPMRATRSPPEADPGGCRTGRPVSRSTDMTVPPSSAPRGSLLSTTGASSACRARFVTWARSSGHPLSPDRRSGAGHAVLIVLSRQRGELAALDHLVDQTVLNSFLGGHDLDAVHL